MNMTYAETRKLGPEEQRYLIDYFAHRWLACGVHPTYPTKLTRVREEKSYGDFIYTEKRIAAHLMQEMQMRINSNGIISEMGIPCTNTGRRLDGVILDDLTKETTVSKLTFSTKFLINGSDISELDNANIYARISAEEKRIADLEKIENKPKRLVAEIEEAKATLKKLVAHLDAQ
jgi:hypothetical protein